MRGDAIIIIDAARKPRSSKSLTSAAGAASAVVAAGVAARTAVMALCWSLSLVAVPAAAAGSWVATAPPLRVIMAERESHSALLQPPASVTKGEIISLVWRFEAPPGADLRGRLCQADTCVEIAGMRGRSRGLSGLPATRPLRFQFSLAPGQRQAVVVRRLQLIVNYL